MVGRIYAASALGSILGTFATGYVLVFYFGVRSILVYDGLTLIALGIKLGGRRRPRAAHRAPEAVTA